MSEYIDHENDGYKTWYTNGISVDTTPDGNAHLSAYSFPDGAFAGDTDAEAFEEMAEMFEEIAEELQR